jgi:hypothetical protein
MREILFELFQGMRQPIVSIGRVSDLDRLGAATAVVKQVVGAEVKE